MLTTNPERNKLFCCKILFAFILLAMPSILAAQDEATILIQRMEQAKGNAKIDLMNEISIVFRKTDRHKSMDYARQAFKLSVENSYLPGKALAKKNEGICWFFIGNNDSAMICYKEALGVFSQVGDEMGMSACYNNLGLIAQETGKYDDALKFYQRSVDMDRKLGDEIGVATTLVNIADIYMYSGNAKKALPVIDKCLEIYAAHSDRSGLLVSYSTRASVFDYLKQYDKAVRDFTETLKLARELKDKYQEIMATSNLGVTYWHWKKPESAMQYLTTALEMSDENDDAYNIDNTLKTIAEINTSQGKYVKANEILQKILNRNVEIENQRQAAIIMTAIGRNLMELNEMDKALGYLMKSLEITVKINAKYEILENYRNLSQANAILHNFKNADSLQDLFAETYASLFNPDSIAGIRKENSEKDSTSLSSASAPSDWIIAFLLFILIVMMSVFGFGRNHNKN